MFNSPASPTARQSATYGRPPLSGITLGLLCSLLVHGMLIYGYRFNWPAGAPHAAPAPPAMTVWLKMETPPPAAELPPPPPPLLAEPAVPELPPLRLPPPRVERQAVKPSAPAMTWVPPAATAASITESAKSAAAPASADPPDPFASPSPKEAAKGAPPRFDMEAARRTARAQAHARDPAKEGTPLAQLPEPALKTETPLAREIRQAARGDCKQGQGGLLAPIYWALDKKDHGCKW